MKIFTADQIREIDSYTIDMEPILSIDLMERAAGALYKWFTENINRSSPVLVFTGPGNNGGDGIALARMLADGRYESVKIYNIRITDKVSADFAENMDRVRKQGVIQIKQISKISDFPMIESGCIIVDCIFGTGLSRKAEDLSAEVIREINDCGAMIISVDIPSGLFSEDNSSNSPDSIIKATNTLSFQFPKLSFMYADNFDYVGEYHILPIGLHPRIIREKKTSTFIIDKSLISSIIRKRKKFEHKGDFGHGLIVAGSCGKAGAAVLASLGCLRTGIGLLTSHVPGPIRTILHTAVPEVMVQCDQSDILVSKVENINNYDAIGMGPGIGTKPNTKLALKDLLDSYKGPLVLDADAINILAEEKGLLNKLTENTILTPHPGEFRRLSETKRDGYNTMLEQLELSAKYKCIIILKGANTSVSLPDGRLWFNTTGNPGMATAGSGDVLTGMILSLLAQGYEPANAAIAGVFLHGYSGDLAAGKYGYESLIATDIINNIGESFKQI